MSLKGVLQNIDDTCGKYDNVSQKRSDAMRSYMNEMLQTVEGLVVRRVYASLYTVFCTE